MTDERDPNRVMDRLLARGLRNALEGSRKDCPDPATLAAYYDRQLSGAEAKRWELHFSVCERCQQHLAALVATDPDLAAKPVSAETTGAPTLARVIPIRGLRRLGASLASGWRWLAPAAAAAAAVALWLAIRPAPPQLEPPATQTEAELPAARPRAPAPEAALPAAPSPLARNNAAQPPAVPAPPRDYPQRAAARTMTDGSGTAAEKRQDTKVAAPGTAELDAKAARDRSAALDGIVAASPPAAKQESSVRAEEKAQEELGTGRKQPSGKTPQATPAREEYRTTPPKPIEGQTPPEAAREAERLKFETPAGKKTAQEQPAMKSAQVTESRDAQPLAEDRQSVAALQRRQAPTRKEKLRALSPSPEAKEGAPPQGQAYTVRAAPVLVSAPGGLVVWRLGPAGRIERSLDSGETWQAQTSGVEVDLLAGSASSESVCWVVGRAGTVLRTTDGIHWEKISLPVAADLVRVEARNARIATLGTSDGRSYSTSDGGQTWQPVSSHASPKKK